MKKHADIISTICFATAMASSTPALAYDEAVEELLVFDGALTPSIDNPELKDDVYVDGSTLVVRIDPTQLFGAIGVPHDALAFAPKSAPPELHSFYLAGAGGGYSVRSGACTKGSDLTAAAAPELSVSCVAQKVTKGWEFNEEGDELYRCQLPEKSPSLKNVVESPQTAFSLVQRIGDRLTCVESYELKLAPEFIGGEIEVTASSENPAVIPLKKKGEHWQATVTLTKGTTRITVRTKRGDKSLFLTLPSFKVKPLTTPSRVRVQAELLTTNGGRTVSYAVALTPVNEKFFTHGPWNCSWLCTISPTMILRLSGDDTTNFQVGGGAAVFLNRAFQINAGVLVGTKDLASRWKLANSWFVGIGVDPFILTEAQTTATTTVKSNATATVTTK